MEMRDLINIVETATGDAADWRAWITNDGHIRETPNDLTHAEDVTFAFRVSREELEDYNDDAAEAAFAKASEAGWIRVGINYTNYEFYAYCDPSTVTRKALYGLLKLLQEKYAAVYSLDAGKYSLDDGDIRQMKAAIQSIARLRPDECPVQQFVPGESFSHHRPVPAEVVVEIPR